MEHTQSYIRIPVWPEMRFLTSVAYCRLGHTYICAVRFFIFGVAWRMLLLSDNTVIKDVVIGIRYDTRSQAINLGKYQKFFCVDWKYGYIFLHGGRYKRYGMKVVWNTR